MLIARVQNMGHETSAQSEHNNLEKEVAGEYNTFRVYVFMLRAKRASVREVQKVLGFSSTWLATHHLKKLERLGLVSKDLYGDYHVVRKSFGVLRLFLVTGRWIVPHTLFFVFMFGIMTMGFLAYLPQHRYFIIAFVISIIGVIVSIIETIRFYRLLPETK